MFIHATYLTDPESLHMWLALPRRWTQRSFVAAAAEAGVLVRSGSMFAVDEASLLIPVDVAQDSEMISPTIPI
ncbi:hypothetical protein E3H11_41325 [Bradyrhizobium brasilense]|nr:hypothetical protein [Bradyrhizobium brasilense]